MIDRETPRAARLLWCALILLVSGPAVRAENGLFPIADGPRQRGRGGTVLGIAEDAMAINSNPAGLAFIEGRRLDLSLATFYSPLRFSDPIQREDGNYLPLVAPSWGYAFEYPSDAVTIFPRLYRLITGGPGAVPTKEAPANGQVAWGTDKLPRRLALMAAGVGSRITKVRVFAYYRKGGQPRHPTVHVLSHDQLPQLPAGARVIGAGVDFLWRYKARMGEATASAVFRCDDRKVSEPLQELGPGWRRHAMSLVLDQKFLPRQIKFSIATEGNEIELEQVRLRVGYVLGGKYRWIKVDMKGPAQAGSGIEVTEIASKTADVAIDSMVPRTIYHFRLSKGLPKGARLLQIKALYNYDYRPSKSVANILRVLLVADGEEVAHTSHSLTEPPEKLPVPPDDMHQRVPLPGKERPWWKLGFGVFGQGGAGVEIMVRTDLFPDGVNNKSELLFASAAPAVAFRLTDWLSVGATALLNYSTLEQDGLVATDLDVMKGTALSGISFSEVFRALTPFRKLRGRIAMEKAQTYGFGARFGIMIKPHKTVSIGLAYTPKTWNRDYKTKASVDFTPTFDASGLSLILPALIFLPNGGLQGLTGRYDVTIKDFQLPQHAGIGVAWTPVKWLRLSTDFKWIDWSDTMTALKVKLANGNNPDVNAIVGSDTIETELPVGWRDQYVVGVGLELFIRKHWVLRTGYNYGNRPVRDGYENPVAPALTVHHITLGLSYIGESIDFHFGYSLGLVEEVEDRDGTNKVSPDWDFSETSFGPQHFFAAGLSFRF